jgi:hypothetical protein
VSPVQFFLASLYAERLAGTQDNPVLRSESLTARRADAVPTEHGLSTATPVAAASR